MFHTVINSLSNVLGGNWLTRVHTIVSPVIMKIGPKVHVGITDIFRLQFKLIVNSADHVHIIVMNGEYFVEIEQDFGVVAIDININFGLDPHFRVGWERFLPHISHTIIQVLVESCYSILHFHGNCIGPQCITVFFSSS